MQAAGGGLGLHASKRGDPSRSEGALTHITPLEPGFRQRIKSTNVVVVSFACR